MNPTTKEAVLARALPLQIWSKIKNFLFRQTSPIHRQDAKEKYWILWRELESEMHARAVELKHYGFTGIKDKRNTAEVEEKFAAFNEFLQKNTVDTGKAKSFGNLLIYARILSKQNLESLNKADALNMMWRDITFVRSRLLTDGIISDERLPDQLEYCRMECAKICPGRDNALEEMCHDTALELVDTNEADSNGDEAKRMNNRKARRTIAMMLAKLNHIRLNDINAQLRIKKIYNVALLLLVLLSFLLLHLNERLTSDAVPYWVAWNQFRETFELTAPYSWAKAPMDLAVYMVQNNLLVFIFFAGLLGGFFSTVMRLRSREVNIGDVYLRTYMLTKPIVGAVAATILYIIIKSNIVALNLGEIQMVDKIAQNSYMFGPLGFAFGFIMGFSERIILPTVGTESGK